MAATPPYRVLSLDFWYTALYERAGGDGPRNDERIRFLCQVLRARDGRDLRPLEVTAAKRETDGRFEKRGRDPITVLPSTLLAAYADALDAEPSAPIDELGRTYSDLGLREHPPEVNPEAVRLVDFLIARGVPVIATTNTSRSEASWQKYLQESTPLRFRHVITSCEVGEAKPHPKIFEEAARRAGVRPAEMLHVGDRWELDVEGALRAGCGAVLYRGLWSRYPEGEYPETDAHRMNVPGVSCIDRLDELLDLDLVR